MTVETTLLRQPERRLPRRGPRATARSSARSSAWPWLAPGLAAMLITTGGPAIATVLISVTDLSIARRDIWTVVGFDNYRRLLAGADAGAFAGVLGWNVFYAAMTTVLSLIIGLGLAIALNDPRIRERALYRTLLIVPWALPSVITVMVWVSLLNGSFGPVNQLLGRFGVDPVPWLTTVGWARVACVLVSVWLSFPFMMTACLGALQSIPRELIEAARVDGASAAVVTRRITVPLMGSAIRPLLVAAFAMQVNNFGVIYLLTGGGPATGVGDGPGGTDILVTYLYKIAFMGADQNYGLASAISVLLFLVVGTLAVLNAWAVGATRRGDGR